MKKGTKDIIESVLNNGKVFRLKCQKCNSISVQISQSSNPDITCYECGGKCKIF